MKISTILPLVATIAAFGATAAPNTYDVPAETAQLRVVPGAGYDAAQGNCLVCHSADYIAIQPPRKGNAFWAGEVAKMINVYRARISPDDAKAISDYLTEQY